MAVYLINIFLILFWGYIFLYKYKSEKNTKVYCGIVALQWILISGLRSPYLSADVYLNYFRRFNETKLTPWSRIIKNILEYVFSFGSNTKTGIDDPGYDVFTKICQLFSTDFQVFLFIAAIAFMVPMAIWVYKNSKDPCFSFVLYSVLFYAFFAITGIRQTIATAIIVFWGNKYVKERKLIKFALLAFIAFTIHKSSLVFIPYYFIANIPITTPYVIIAAAVIVVVTLSGKSLYGALAEWIGYGKEQVEYAKGGAETYAAALALMCIIILIFYYFYKNKTENATRIFNITLLTLMSSLLVFQNQSFMRIQQYYSLFLCVSFPEVIFSIKKESRAFIYLLVIMFLILYLITNNPKYWFFWQGGA